MRYIPCTIQSFRCKSEDTWIISVPFDAVKNASERFTELLSGTRRNIVFLDSKTEFTITADSAICSGRRIPITKDFLECLKKLFSSDIQPGKSHLDYDFSDRCGDVTITVLVV